MVHVETPRYQLDSDLLTERQASVLLWLAEGKTQREIAMIMGVTPSAIEVHLRRTKERFNASTPAEVLAICFSEGKILRKLESRHTKFGKSVL